MTSPKNIDHYCLILLQDFGSEKWDRTRSGPIRAITAMDADRGVRKGTYKKEEKYCTGQGVQLVQLTVQVPEPPTFMMSCIPVLY